MQKINYFQYRQSNENEFIFSKKKSNSGMLSRSVTVSRLGFRHNTIDNFVHKKNNLSQCGSVNNVDTLQEDECPVAEEFNENEQHIATDLAKRDADKMYTFSKLLDTPKSIPPSDYLLCFNRKRSVSSICSGHPRGVFLRASANLASMVKKNPLNIIKEEQKMEPLNSRKRTSSEIGHKKDNKRRLCQKENIGAIGNSHLKTASKILKQRKGIRIDESLGIELKGKIDVLMNKGMNKFSNTMQAKPKIIVRKEEAMLDLPDTAGDELNTIRTSKIARIPYNIIKHI